MTLNPSCYVNSTVPPVEVGDGYTASIALISNTGVESWQLLVQGTDELSNISTLQAEINANMNIAAKTTSFIMPNTGVAVILRSTVFDSAGNSNSTTFKVYSLTSLGYLVGALSETVEQDPTGFGSTSILNQFARNGSSGGGGSPTGAAGGDLGGTYPGPTVEQAQTGAILFTLDGSNNSSVKFANYTTASILQASASGTANNLTIQAQGSTGASKNGGELILAGGVPGVGGVAGSVSIKTGSAQQLLLTPTTITLAALAGNGTGLVGVDNSGNLSYNTGDVTAASGSNTVAKLQGITLTVGSPITGTQLAYNGTIFTPAVLNLAGGSGYVTGLLPAANQAAQTMVGDVTGTTGASVVSAISGISPILITPAKLEWAANTASATLTQATTSINAGGNMTITPQLGTTDGYGNVAGGSLIINLQEATGTGTESDLVINRGGSLAAAIGPYGPTSGLGGSFSAIWLGPSLGTLHTYNFALMSNGSSYTYFNVGSSGTMNFIIDGNGDGGLQMLTSGTTATSFNPIADIATTLGTSTARWSTIYAQSGLSGGASVSGAGANMTIQAEGAESGSGDNGGNLILEGGQPDGSGKAGLVSINAGQALAQRTVATTYAIDGYTTADLVVFTNATSVGFTVTLPVPSAGRNVFIKDVAGNATSKNITISHNASEKIDGASTYVLNLNYASVQLCSDGTNWFVVSAYNGSVI